MVYQYDNYEWYGYEYPVSATEVGRLCESIEREKGSVTKENLLDAARAKDSIIHECFEWDNEKAGELYRLSQSGKMLSSLRVVISGTAKNDPVKVRLFHNTNESNTKGEYHSVTVISCDEQLYQGMLKRAKKELQAFMDKYNTLEELFPIIEIIESFLNCKKEAV